MLFYETNIHMHLFSYEQGNDKSVLNVWKYVFIRREIRLAEKVKPNDGSI